VLFLTSSGSTAGSTQAPVHVIKNGKSALIWAKDRSAVKDAFIDQ
jgi:hypothetical protein